MEAIRFLDAPETVDDEAVARLRDLRHRSTIDGYGNNRMKVIFLRPIAALAN